MRENCLRLFGPVQCRPIDATSKIVVKGATMTRGGLNEQGFERRIWFLIVSQTT